MSFGPLIIVQNLRVVCCHTTIFSPLKLSSLGPVLLTHIRDDGHGEISSGRKADNVEVKENDDEVTQYFPGPLRAREYEKGVDKVLSGVSPLCVENPGFHHVEANQSYASEQKRRNQTQLGKPFCGIHIQLQAETFVRINI